VLEPPALAAAVLHRNHMYAYLFSTISSPTAQGAHRTNSFLESLPPKENAYLVTRIMTSLNPDIMYEWEESQALGNIEFQGTKVEVLDITNPPVGCSIGREILWLSPSFAKILLEQVAFCVEADSTTGAACSLA
jgi:hypothetical protein